MTGDALSIVFKILLLFGAAVLAGRLYSTGLYRSYPVLFAYIVFRIPNNLWPLFFDRSSNTYFYLYIATFPIQTLFYIVLVRELYRLVLADYKGLQTVGRWAMTVSVVCGVAIAIMTLLPRIQPSMPQVSKAMGVVIYAERGLNTALAVFIILLLAILSRYPIRLRRNVRVHAVIYSIFFLSSTASSMARAVMGLKGVEVLATAHVVVQAGCILAWLFLLNRAGEETPATKPAIADKDQERLLLQLQGLNAAFLRVSRQ